MVGAGRGPVGRRSVSGGGGERFPRYGLLPRLPQAGIEAGRLVCVFLGATVLLRPTAPTQSRRPAAVYAGVSARPTGGVWRAAAFTAAAASPPWVQRPLWGGAGLPSLWSAPGSPRANQRKPKETKGNQRKPKKETKGNQRKPKETKGNQRQPKATKGTKGNQREPKGTKGNQREPKGTKGNQREPKGTKGNQREPKETKGNQRKPKETKKGNQRKPKETKGNQRKPKETKGAVGRGARLRWGRRPAALPPVPPPRPLPGPMGRGRYRRCCLCGGWGCGGGGFRRR